MIRSLLIWALLLQPLLVIPAAGSRVDAPPAATDCCSACPLSNCPIDRPSCESICECAPADDRQAPEPKAPRAQRDLVAKATPTGRTLRLVACADRGRDAPRESPGASERGPSNDLAARLAHLCVWTT